MTAFYVGQRVKVISLHPGGPRPSGRHPLCGRVEIGETGTIVGTPNQMNSGFNPVGKFDVSLLLDRHPVCGMAPSCCLAPLADSYEKVCWEDCEWQPEHMRDVA